MEAETIERAAGANGLETPPEQATRWHDVIPRHLASFYHLNGVPMAGKLCNGMASFWDG